MSDDFRGAEMSYQMRKVTQCQRQKDFNYSPSNSYGIIVTQQG